VSQVLRVIRHAKAWKFSKDSSFLERVDDVPAPWFREMVAIALEGSITRVGRLIGCIPIPFRTDCMTWVIVDCLDIEAVPLSKTQIDLEPVTGEELVLCRRNFQRAMNLAREAQKLEEARDSSSNSQKPIGAVSRASGAVTGHGLEG
jgi:hypothetical protein